MTAHYDYDEVARIVTEAVADVENASAALALHFRISRTGASNLIRRARAAGKDMPKVGPGPLPGGGRRMADVANIAREALAAGRPMSLAVAEEYGIAPRSATRLISQARSCGQVIPADLNRPTGYTTPATDNDPTGPRLRCADCGEMLGLNMRRMIEHTVSAHHRAPSHAERIPQTAAA